MENITLGQSLLNELESETPASRKCLERIPITLKEYKPHEKSMAMGYLTLLVAEIPLWIAVMAEGGDIDFATWKHFEPKSTADVDNPFPLKRNGQVLVSAPAREFISSTINHLVHHRGQLTVYMRLNDILVPSIYGPSADEKGF